MFTMCLTHDVDVFQKPNAIRILRRSFKQGIFSPRKIIELISCQNPYDTFDDILSMEAKYDAKSTFFFLVRNHDTPLFREITRKTREHNCEVALHGSSRSETVLSMLKRQKNLLELSVKQSVVGNRFHKLKLDMPRSFEIERAINLRYDSTFHPPYYGMQKISHPFFIIDGLLEIPITIMERDYAELIPEIGLEKTWKRIESVLMKIRDLEGVCTISWHNHSFFDENNIFHQTFYSAFRGMKKLYQKILEWAIKSDARFCTCEEVCSRGIYGKENYWF